MRKTVLQISFGIFVLSWAIWFSDGNLQTELLGLVVGIAGAIGIEFLDYMYEQRHFLRLYWDCYKPWGRPELRLTLAYLYKIEVNGKYLLIKSNRIENTYQPVGGVYKYFYPEAKSDLDSIGAVTDNKINNDDTSEFDLRLTLLSRKKIGKFLNWFFTTQERERDPWREFYEELVEPGVLPSEEFRYIHYELIGQHFEPIHFDKFFQVDTFKYVDIYRPKLINSKQIDEFKKLLSRSSSEYIWVTVDEIQRGKSSAGHLIAEHTYKIFKTNKVRL